MRLNQKDGNFIDLDVDRGIQAGFYQELI